MLSAIRSKATEFDCIFSWSLAIRVLAIYIGYSRFRFAVRSRMHLDGFVRLSLKSVNTKFRKILAKVSVNTKKKFHKIHK